MVYIPQYTSIRIVRKFIYIIFNTQNLINSIFLIFSVYTLNSNAIDVSVVLMISEKWNAFCAFYAVFLVREGKGACVLDLHTQIDSLLKLQHSVPKHTHTERLQWKYGSLTCTLSQCSLRIREIEKWGTDYSIGSAFRSIRAPQHQLRQRQQLHPRFFVQPHFLMGYVIGF